MENLDHASQGDKSFLIQTVYTFYAFAAAFVAAILASISTIALIEARAKVNFGDPLFVLIWFLVMFTWLIRDEDEKRRAPLMWKAYVLFTIVLDLFFGVAKPFS